MLRMVPLPTASRQGGLRTVQHLGELDRVLERELGARADREMRGVRGVAQEDDVAARPAFALDSAEVEPGGGADQVRCVGFQAVAVKIFGEDALAGGDGGGMVYAVEAEGGPVV